MVFDHVDKVRTVGGIDGGAYEFELVGFGCFEILGGDVAVFDHLGEDAVAGVDGAVGMDLGVCVVGRSADDATEESALGDVEVANILAKVSLGGFTKSANGERAAIAEVNLVGIEGEDLLFAEALIKLESDDGFFDFAAPAAFGGKEEGASNLHIDGGGALRFGTVPKVGPSGAEDADGVEAAVVEEALIFGRKHGFNEDFGHVVKADQAAFFTGGIEKIGEDFRLDLGVIKFGIVGEADKFRNVVPSEIDTDGVTAGEVRARAGANLEGFGGDDELAGGVGSAEFLVAGVNESGFELRFFVGFAAVDILGSSKDARSVLENVAGEAAVDHAAEGNVVVDEDGGTRDEEQEGDAEKRETDARSPEAAAETDAEAALEDVFDIVEELQLSGLGERVTGGGVGCME